MPRPSSSPARWRLATRYGSRELPDSHRSRVAREWPGCRSPRVRYRSPSTPEDVGPKASTALAGCSVSGAGLTTCVPFPVAAPYRNWPRAVTTPPNETEYGRTPPRIAGTVHRARPVAPPAATSRPPSRSTPFHRSTSRRSEPGLPANPLSLRSTRNALVRPCTPSARAAGRTPTCSPP